MNTNDVNLERRERAKELRELAERIKGLFEDDADLKYNHSWDDTCDDVDPFSPFTTYKRLLDMAEKDEKGA